MNISTDAFDAILAERDGFRERAIVAEQERDWLKRAIESFRDSVVGPTTGRDIVYRLDAILKGES